MLYRTFIISLLLVGWEVASSASAQPAPSLPVLEPSFSLSPEAAPQPSPCFEFGCYDAADFDADTLIASGITYAAVYVWVRDEAGTWSMQATLLNPEPPVLGPPNPDVPPVDPRRQDSYYGDAVAISGDDVLVSSRYRDETTGLARAQVYVFRRQGTVWRHRQTIVPEQPDPAQPVQALTLRNGLAALHVGGAVALYRRGFDGRYRAETVLQAPVADARFGDSVALEGRTVVVGAPGENGGAGAAYVYERGLFRWRLAQKLTSASPEARRFGSAVALSGWRLAISAPGTNNGEERARGTIELYLRDWTQYQLEQRVLNPVPAGEDRTSGFATRLALRGSRLLAGSTAGGGPFGAMPWAYLYQLGEEGFQLQAALAQGSTLAVRISGPRALVVSAGARAGAYPSIFELPSP